MVGIVAHGHHLGAGFEHEVLRREHVAFEPLHKVRRPGRLRLETVFLGIDALQTVAVEAVRLLVAGKEVHGLLALRRLCAEACDEHVAVLLAHAALADIGEDAQQLAVVLAVLFVEIADHRVELAPCE